MQNKLIHGKNDLDRIVAIEPRDEIAVIFRELEDGAIDTLEVPHRYWILSNVKHSDKWNRLEGNQHYKFGKQFTKLKDFYEEKKQLRKRNADIYSIGNAAEACMIKDGYTMFLNMYHDKISVLSWDIETTGLEHNADSKVLLISNTYRSATGEIERKLFCYDDYENCADMIDDWAAWVCKKDPSLIIGHHIYGYDFPYINYCHSKYSDKPIILGREKKQLEFSKYESKFRVDGSRDLHYFKASIYGRQIVDTMFLAYKYDLARKYESYALKKIVAQEGLEKEGRVFYEASKIRENYKIPEEWKKIKAYAEDDADDSLSLYDLMSPTMFYLCPSVPKPFQLMIESASGSQINSMMVRAYLQDKRSIAKTSEAVEYQGAISFGIPGIYKNCFKMDFSQLYPSIMMQFGVYDKFKDPDAYFKQIVIHFANARQEQKRKYKETNNIHYYYLEQVSKVIANSCYGFLGAPGLAYNSPEQAAFITEKGREYLEYSIEYFTSQKAEKWIELFNETTK